MGPTATGKSALAVGLAAQIGGEVVSVDSCAIYRGLDIGSAKPPLVERGGIAHHLIDIRNPDESYSVGQFVDDAKRLASGIAARGRVPVFAGGTMMYFNALLRGLSGLPSTPAEVRAEVNGLMDRLGPEALHATLAARDPQMASRLHPNDRQRIGRALEVIAAAGRPLSDLQRESPPTSPFGSGCVPIGMMPSDTQALNKRIAERIRDFVRRGWADEVSELLGRDGVGPKSQSMRTVGYREMVRHTLGGIPLDKTLELAETATRRLAKRQRTWLRSMRDCAVLVDPQRGDALEEVRRIVSAQLDSRAAGDS